MKIIETLNLTKYYGKSRGIIDVNLEVNQGEIFGFIGPNGSGKSTTIRTLLNLIFPTKGEAKIFGMDCIKDSKAIRKDIGYLPSQVSYYDDMKVKDLLYYSGKFYTGDYTKRINELADILDLDLNKKIEDLSTGNKKKTAIIQAMLHKPKLLILDEPTGGLDPLMQNTFFELINEENKRGVTIFFSSHILSEVQKMCHRVAIIKEGKILKVEDIEELRKNKFKNIKIEFKNSKDTDLDIEGIIDKEKTDKTVRFLYNGNINSLFASIVNKDVNDINIEDPSLEEVFIHYYKKGEK